jgi:hypothetical protein
MARRGRLRLAHAKRLVAGIATGLALLLGILTNAFGLLDRISDGRGGVEDHDNPRTRGCDRDTVDLPAVPVPNEVAGMDGATVMLRIGRQDDCRGAVWALVRQPRTTPCDPSGPRCFSVWVVRRSEDGNSPNTPTRPRDQHVDDHSIHSNLLFSKDREFMACVAPVDDSERDFCTPWTATERDPRSRDARGRS